MFTRGIYLCPECLIDWEFFVEWLHKEAGNNVPPISYCPHCGSELVKKEGGKE